MFKMQRQGGAFGRARVAVPSRRGLKPKPVAEKGPNDIAGLSRLRAPKTHGPGPPEGLPWSFAFAFLLHEIVSEIESPMKRGRVLAEMTEHVFVACDGSRIAARAREPASGLPTRS